MRDSATARRNPGLGLITSLVGTPARQADRPRAEVYCPRCYCFLGRAGGTHCGGCGWSTRTGTP